MEGDFFNVMGFPLHKVYRELDKLFIYWSKADSAKW
jgi:predicted house-cleaning NTP pyrophosphatase (Maf/HAM1 superfamily)